MTRSDPDLVEALLEGDHRALARTITKIENREPGYREVVAALYEHTGDARVIGVTGSPGAGKSTLVDKLAKAYRDRGLTVGVVAVDPSSPYTGGSVLGDRIRMGSNVGDMDVFVRSMSTRGSLGGLSTATADAVKALDAFGKDRIIVETVGAGQNEIDVVRTADTVAVLVPPDSGDDVQMLKAGILEIGDVFVVNKADLAGADRTVQELGEMLQLRDRSAPPDLVDGDDRSVGGEGPVDDAGWEPAVIETVATGGDGVDDLLAVLDDHHDHLVETGLIERKRRNRLAEEIRHLLREDTGGLIEAELERHGGMAALVDAVAAGDTDPYAIADDVIGPIEECLRERRGATRNASR